MTSIHQPISQTCPLCSAIDVNHYATDKRRDYFICSCCDLVFAAKDSWPTPTQEKNEYDLHENDVSDEGYNRFLARMIDPLTQRVPQGGRILDFGCGPAPALAQQLTNHGYNVSLYDSFYQPDNAALNAQYDAIVLTEVIEHLHQPNAVMTQLWQQIVSGGWLAIMTQRVISQAAFENWQYKNDPTHVCFYSEATFHWLAKRLSASAIAFEGRDMVFIKK